MTANRFIAQFFGLRRLRATYVRLGCTRRDAARLGPYFDSPFPRSAFSIRSTEAPTMHYRAWGLWR